MIRRVLCIVLALLSPAGAQVLQVVGPAPAPGGVATALLLNDTADPISYHHACALFALTPKGDLADVSIVGSLGCDTQTFLAPGEQRSLGFVAPTAAGSWFLVFRGETVGGRVRAACRLDVGVPSSSFPDLVLYPSRLPQVAVAHEADFANPTASPWDVANVGPLAHVFGAGDKLSLLPPGGSAAAAELFLGGVSVPAGGVLELPLPLNGLTPGPYTVRASFLDPGLGAWQQLDHGLRAQGSGVDLHLGTGKELSPGGVLRASLVVTGFGLPTGTPVVYALLLCAAPGVTPMPGGQVFPLAFDLLAYATLTTDLGGFLHNRIGTVAVSPLPWLPGFVDDVLLTHPGVPLGGITLRAAALAWHPASGSMRVSQPELISVW